MTGIPICNVNNNCSTGSTGLAMAKSMVSHGVADCVMVVGFEKMNPGSLVSHFQDRENPVAPITMMMTDTRGFTSSPAAAQMFGNAGLEYMEKYGAKKEDFAEIGRVNHAHSKHNPYSQFQQEYSLEEVLKAPPVFEMLTKLQCCPTSDGSAAAIVVSQDFLDKKPHLKEQAVLIAGQSLKTDTPATFNRSSIDLMGFQMSRNAVRAATKEAGVRAKDAKVCELHDCFSANEMITIDALELCEPGRAHEMVRKGDITYGGKMVINPSGRLISKGHPLGATGLAQCAELVWHLRGWANNRAIPGTDFALQHNIGLGGAVVVTVYRRSDGMAAKVLTDADIGKRNGLGYNPATAAKGFTAAQADSVLSNERSEWALSETPKKVLARF
ncbi:sterol carrier protein 2 [Ascosphaera atra]|nr:sterol carrier protein 2 [Ascosphaera atra]